MDVRDVYDPKLVGIDAAVILGVQQCSTFDLMHTTEMPFVYLDKGYTRTWDYRRVAINDAQPTGYMPHWIKPDDRHKKFGWEFLDRETDRFGGGVETAIRKTRTFLLADRGGEQFGGCVVVELTHGTHGRRPLVFLAASAAKGILATAGRDRRRTVHFDP